MKIMAKINDVPLGENNPGKFLILLLLARVQVHMKLFPP
jgi:hypothetical protein